MLFRLLVLTLGCLSVNAAFGQSGKKKAKDGSASKVAELKVGDMAPEFELLGKEDKTFKLKDFRKSDATDGKNVVVVFVRANW